MKAKIAFLPRHGLEHELPPGRIPYKANLWALKVLAKELELCYTSIAVVTDYDVGIVAKEKIKPVSTKEILETFSINMEKAKKLVLKMIEKIPDEKKCDCEEALDEARIGEGTNLWPEK